MPSEMSLSAKQKTKQKAGGSSNGVSGPEQGLGWIACPLRSTTRSSRSHQGALTADSLSATAHALPGLGGPVASRALGLRGARAVEGPSTQSLLREEQPSSIRRRSLSGRFSQAGKVRLSPIKPDGGEIEGWRGFAGLRISEGRGDPPPNPAPGCAGKGSDIGGGEKLFEGGGQKPTGTKCSHYA